MTSFARDAAIIGTSVALGLVVTVALVIVGNVVLGRLSRRSRVRVRVVHVCDGDTIVVTLPSGKRETVRLLGVDAPETVHPDMPVQPFGPEASAFTRRELLGKTVTLHSDPSQADRDRYGRLLRYVWDGNGRLFQVRQLRQGYAREYTFGGRAYRYQRHFKAVEAAARREKRGLWHERNQRNGEVVAAQARPRMG